MLGRLKQASFRILKASGAFSKFRDSAWRRNQLLLLCYHGISQRDEHEWNPELYMRREDFAARMRFLAEEGYRVLALDTAIRLWNQRRLPNRSVVLTFDDGNFDFWSEAYPILRKFGFPVTVYLTTYYCDDNRPPFRLICSYMFWRQRGQVFQTRIGGSDWKLDLRTPLSRGQLLAQFDGVIKRQRYSAGAQEELASEIAKAISVDYNELKSQRLLHIMNPNEVQQLSSEGVDFQLHTHRHRTPFDETLFRLEISDNATRIRELTGREPQHFCYPSGVHRPEFLRWLANLKIISATTCQPGLISSTSNPLLLPRLVDTSLVPMVVFDAWVSGVAGLLPRRRHPAVDPN